MMFYQKFDAEISAKSVQELIDKIHDQPFVTLHFSTNGGEYSSILMLVDYLNSRKDTVFVVFDYVILSAGFLLLAKLKCNYTFNESFEKALMHKVDAATFTQRKEKGEERRGKLLSNINNNILKMLIKLGITEKQQEKFKKGGDLNFYKKDLKRMGLWKKGKNSILKEIKKAIKEYKKNIEVDEKDNTK